MGKDRKGKELGKGLTQRKDGYYSAKFTARDGTHPEKYFKTLREAQRWLADAKADDEQGALVLTSTMSVDAWFEKWMNIKKTTVRDNTVRNYRERYENNIKQVIGRMSLIDVKPMHCQKILNQMAEDEYAGSTIRMTLNTMITMFYAAYENDLIRKSPVTKSNVKMPKEVEREIDFFTIEEQKQFLAVAKDYAYYEQFRLILETGLRTGEVIGLTWDCVDLEERTITIDKTLGFRYSDQEWKWGPPKTSHGYRTIYLTAGAYEVLKSLKEKESFVNDSTPDEFKNLVFLCKKGMPVKNSTYDNALVKRCEMAGVKKLSMHDLRHTCATRFIECSNNYKFLSGMLGHSSIKITLDLYVHETEETKKNEIMRFSNYLNDTISE